MGRILVAGALIAVALYMQAEAAGYPRVARRLPMLLGYVVIALAALAIVQQTLLWRRERARGTLKLASAPPWRELAIGSAFVLLIVLYAWAIPVLGYLIATPLMLLLPIVALRPIGPKLALVAVTAVTASIWALFVWFLNLPIPLYPGA